MNADSLRRGGADARPSRPPGIGSSRSAWLRSSASPRSAVFDRGRAASCWPSRSSAGPRSSSFGASDRGAAVLLAAAGLRGAGRWSRRPSRRDPRTSFVDSKQLVLFLLVPAVYRLVRGTRALDVLDVIITRRRGERGRSASSSTGCCTTTSSSQRPQGTLGHYMTYSGLLMLVIGAALAQLLFDEHDRIWAALVMPALAVAVALTFTRRPGSARAPAAARCCSSSRISGCSRSCRSSARSRSAVAPGPRSRSALMSMFDRERSDQPRSRRDAPRGPAHDADHPLIGVGPNMVERCTRSTATRTPWRR